jgi:predicted NBD/HSP70 family sugar kinase
MSSKPRTRSSSLRAGKAGAKRSFRLPRHGALDLPTVRIDSYNLDIKYQNERLAAATNKGALKMALERWRKAASRSGSDPFGKRASTEITKKELDEALASEDDEARCIVLGAIEDFARSLAQLAERILLVPTWQRTECLVVGGGLRSSRTGELIIRRTQALLNDRNIAVELRAITSHPHKAALLGAAHLVPSWVLAGHDAILAADLGGTNLRVGIVTPNLEDDRTLSKAEVWKWVLWRHADDRVKREDIVRTMAKTMKRLLKSAKSEGLRIAPFIGVACPGLIGADGSIGTGSHVLPGNWQSARFNLPARLADAIPRIGGNKTLVLLHNDAVLQGLSEIPFLGHCRRWGVFTIGTGLGNARFTLA